MHLNCVFLAIAATSMIAIVVAAGGEDTDGIFTSNTDLQSLLYTEGELVRSLHRYLEDEEKKLQKLKR